MNASQDYENISYEDLVRDPELVEQLRRRARRMRAIEGGEALGTAVRTLFDTDNSGARSPGVRAPIANQGALANG